MGKSVKNNVINVTVIEDDVVHTRRVALKDLNGAQIASIVDYAEENPDYVRKDVKKYLNKKLKKEIC